MRKNIENCKSRSEWLDVKPGLMVSVTRCHRSDESESLDVSFDLTDVTLMSEDTNKRLNWCDPDFPDEVKIVREVKKKNQRSENSQRGENNQRSENSQKIIIFLH